MKTAFKILHLLMVGGCGGSMLTLFMNVSGNEMIFRLNLFFWVFMVTASITIGKFIDK